MSHPEAGLDDINLDTLLSADSLFAEWDVGEYDNLADFMTNGPSSHLTTTVKPSSSRRSDRGTTSTKKLSLAGDNGKAAVSVTGSALDKKTPRPRATHGGKNKQNHVFKVVGKSGKSPEAHSVYSVSTKRDGAYSLFSTKEQREDGLQSESFTTAMANKVRARMAHLAKESCGISPSMTFHPYMTLPEEVSMQRIGRHFPLLDLICSTTVAQDSNSLSSEAISNFLKQLTKNTVAPDSRVDSDDSSDNYTLLQVFQQFLGINNDISLYSNVSLKAGAYAGSNTTSVARAVNEVNQGNMTQLIFELEDAWRLTQRQCMFFKQNLSNLSQWCQQNFTPDMNKYLFSADRVYSSLNEQLSSTHSNNGAYAYATAIGASLDSLVSFYSPPATTIYCQSDPSKLLFVRVKMNETLTDNYPRLFAILSPEEGMRWNGTKPSMGQKLFRNAPLKGQNALNDHQKKRNRKLPSNKSNTSSKKAIASHPMTLSDTLLNTSLDEVAALSQKKSISSALTETAATMEKLITERNMKRKLDTDQIEQKISSNDYLTSTELWNVLQQQGTLSAVPSTDMNDVLSIAWNPELPTREMCWGDIPPPIVNSRLEKPTSDMDGVNNITPSSLYHRLQSLLVEENSDHCTNVDDVPGMDDNEKISKVELAIVDDYAAETDEILDVSGLSIDQRAYIHLRSSNLIDQSILSDSPQVIDEFDESNDAPLIDIKSKCDDLDDNIRKMQVKLSKKHRMNNERASYLFSEAKKELSSSIKTEQTYIIETYSQLLKKQRDSKKTNRISGDLPW
jgi:hypothetical protein